MTDKILTRREFLKLSSATLLGLLLADLQPRATLAAVTPKQGRVQATSLIVRDAPAFSGRKLRSVKRDVLLDLAEQVYGGEEGDYNRHWYRLSDQGYVYSGWVQPVETISNPPVTEIPATGVLGEISLPYVDSFYGINSSVSPGPRLYYATTHWITKAVVDKRDGSLWYKAFDAATQSHYYTRPAWVHLFSPEELAPLSAQVPQNEKHIEIYLDRQLLLAFEWDGLVYAARVATGRRNFESPIGLSIPSTNALLTICSAGRMSSPFSICQACHGIPISPTVGLLFMGLTGIMTLEPRIAMDVLICLPRMLNGFFVGLNLQSNQAKGFHFNLGLGRAFGLCRIDLS